jgi:hypothetical protein
MDILHFTNVAAQKMLLILFLEKNVKLFIATEKTIKMTAQILSWIDA